MAHNYIYRNKILSAELNKIHIFILFNLEFGVAKDKLVSSSYKYNPKYC